MFPAHSLLYSSARNQFPQNDRRSFAGIGYQFLKFKMLESIESGADDIRSVVDDLLPGPTARIKILLFHGLSFDVRPTGGAARHSE